MADKRNDGAERKLYRLTKPGTVEDTAPQTQDTVAGNVVALFDAGTYAEVEATDNDGVLTDADIAYLRKKRASRKTAYGLSGKFASLCDD